MLLQRGKQTEALEISSWLLFWMWKDFGVTQNSLCCVVVSLCPLISSVTSHVSNRQAALVPLSLPTWDDSWVAHHHTDVSLFRPSMPSIVSSAVTWTFIWDVTVSVGQVGLHVSQLKTISISFYGWKRWFHHVPLAYEWRVTMELSETILQIKEMLVSFWQQFFNILASCP